MQNKITPGTLVSATEVALETRTHRFWLRPEGYLYCKIKEEAEINYTDAVASIEAIAKITGNMALPVFCDARQLKSASKEAREYYAGVEAQKNLKAAAILIGSPLTKSVVNFFLLFNKPPYPIKMFTSEEEALQWIKKSI